MEKTYTLTITESQAKRFEKLLDDFIETVNRIEKESVERDARMDKMQREFQIEFAEVKKMSEETGRRLSKWQTPTEK